LLHAHQLRHLASSARSRDGVMAGVPSSSAPCLSTGRRAPPAAPASASPLRWIASFYSICELH
jgi:hypothetical protein